MKIEQIERHLQGNDADQYDIVLKSVDEARATLRSTHQQILRARGASPELYKHSALAKFDSLFSQFVGFLDEYAEKTAGELRAIGGLSPS